MNVGIFAIISHVSGYNEKMSLIKDYRGLGYRAPVLSAVMSFFLISLIGIPFTAGFFGKFYVFSAALNAGATWLAIIGLVNSGIAAFYYLRVVATAYTRPEEGTPPVTLPRFSVALTLALVLTLGATLVLGIVPNGALNLAQQGAADFDKARTLPDDPDAGGAKSIASSYTK
jgi:NADH-quinone oxidoreductase subunit N